MGILETRVSTAVAAERYQVQKRVFKLYRALFLELSFLYRNLDQSQTVGQTLVYESLYKLHAMRGEYEVSSFHEKSASELWIQLEALLLCHWGRIKPVRHPGLSTEGLVSFSDECRKLILQLFEVVLQEALIELREVNSGEEGCFDLTFHKWMRHSSINPGKQGNLDQYLDQTLSLGVECLTHTWINHFDAYSSFLQSIEELNSSSDDLSSEQAVCQLLRSACSSWSSLLNKKVEFKFYSNGLGLSNELWMDLIPVFLQLLRNSLDHGIESTQERAISGKSEEGSIEISISGRDEQIELIYSDDGRGIQTTELMNRAIEQGLLSIKQQVDLSDEERRELVFLPGLSTQRVHSLFSGTGVGMSFVRDKLRSIGAEIRIDPRVCSGLRLLIRFNK